MKRLLIQTQLSNINYKHNKFDLACDSGWQMVIGRVRQMLKLNSELDITVMGPYNGEFSSERQLVETPWEVNPDLWGEYGHEGAGRLHYAGHRIMLNALATRYDFHYLDVVDAIGLGDHKMKPSLKYDAVYVNDPMHLRNLMTMFYLTGGYQPKFYVHSHFVDVPEVPKFPKEASLWLGQCEAALKADYNFWQCESAMLQFQDSMGKWFTQDVVDDVRAKSMPWDDGYSASEILTQPNMDNVRFTPEEWKAKTQGKTVLFFPNRISPSSGDYTNGMKFMFEVLPKLRQQRQDFVVVCGNPNQKFSNKELEEKCGANGYVKLADDTFNRDEYKWVGKHSHIALGLYNVDAYGGTAARELVELGCVPVWLDNYEYSRLAREADLNAPVSTYVLAKPDFSNLVDVVDSMIDRGDMGRQIIRDRLCAVVQQQCSYESTTHAAMQKMGLLP